MILRRIDPVSVGRIFGLLYALLGLFMGACFAVFGTLGAALAGGSRSPLLGLFFGVGALVFMPVIYGALGFLSSLIGAAIYNLVAGWIGGIEVDLVAGTTTGAQPRSPAVSADSGT